MQRVFKHVPKGFGRRQVIADAASGEAAIGSGGVGPCAENVDQDVSAKTSGQHLGDDVEIGDERRLEDDGNVGGVEELNWVGRVLAAVAGGFDWQIDAEPLKSGHINQNRKQLA